MQHVRVRCESVLPSETFVNDDGRRVGRCIRCGFVGLLRQTRTLLYQHNRTETYDGEPELTEYVSAYMDEWIHGIQVHWCLECGAMVKDQDAHDDFHLSLVHDLNQLRQRVMTEGVAQG